MCTHLYIIVRDGGMRGTGIRVERRESQFQPRQTSRLVPDRCLNLCQRDTGANRRPGILRGGSLIALGRVDTEVYRVVFTWRGENLIRIISAQKASRDEREIYHRATLP